MLTPDRGGAPAPAGAVPPADTPRTTCTSYEGAAPARTWAEVTALFVAAFSAEPYGEDPRELAQLSTWGPAQLARPGGRLTVAHRDGRPAGLALLHRLDAEESWPAILRSTTGHPAVAAALRRPRDAVVLHELAVEPGFRGRGVARDCLREVLRDRDETHVFVGVHESAPQARAVYERWGLERAGAFRGADADVTLLVLTRRVADLRARLGRPPTAAGG